jgi:hypothetical protein
MYDLPKLAAIIANERLVNHLVDYGYAAPIKLLAFHTYNRSITLASNTSVTRILSISPHPSSHSAPSAPSGEASSTAALLLFGTTPQCIIPSATTLTSRSTRNVQGNRDPILATVRLYCIFQLDVFDCCPCTFAPTRSADVGIQDTQPSTPTL